jgi:DNA polymerase I - 3''-5'' exonuclease and polymerase domains
MSAIGIKPLGKLWDVELMHYLLMPERSHKIEILSQSYLGINLESEREFVQADLFSSQNIAAEEESAEKLNAEASVMIPLAHKLREELESEGTLKLYEDIEMPLIFVLASMEQEGVKLDTSMLKEYGMALSKELDDIEKRVRDMAEDPSLNVSSPKQLSVILYDKMDLGLGKKGGGRSTDEETLMEIIDKHPIIPAILEFRNLKKLISTYIEPLPALVSKAAESFTPHTIKLLQQPEDLAL